MIKENDGRLNPINYLIDNYKLDSTKNPINQLNLLYQELYEKIIYNNENLDIHHNLKLIDSIQMNLGNSDDIYVVTTFLTVIALQMNYNQIKKEIFIKFIERNINSLKHEIFLPYLYKMVLFEINLESLQLNDIGQITEKTIKNIQSNIHNVEYLSFFYYNIISFIHYNEFSVIILSEKLKCFKTRIQLCKENLKLLIVYFFWKNQNEHLYFNPDIILKYILKFYSIYLIELTIEYFKQNKEFELDLNEIISIYLDLIFKLNFETTSLYIIAILSVLIIYLKIFKNTHIHYHLFKDKIKQISTNNQFINKNDKFIFDYLTSAKYNCDLYENQIQIDCIILLKLLEFNYFIKYNKNVDLKYRKRNFLNSTDFIMKGLFFYEKAYDFINLTCKNFNDRSIWNFCELLKMTYEGYPKIIKHTIIRHLKFSPNDENLLYNLTQYYYLNKNRRNSKILIKKILAKENSLAISEISCLILLMLININLINEKYGEALKLAIINLDRSKEFINDKELSARSYYILGICYSKIGEHMTNYDDRLQNNLLALGSFKNARDKDSCNNPLYLYYLARQHLELREIKEARQIANLIEMSELSVKNENIFLTLKALIFLSQHNYNDAYELLDNFIKKNKYHFKHYSVIILMNYIMIFKALSAIKIYTEFEQINNSLINSLNGVINEIDKEIDQLESLNNQRTNEKRNSDHFKRLINYNNFDENYKEEGKDSSFDFPKGKIVYDKKNLESVRIQILKNFFYLYNIIRENKFENHVNVLNCLNNKLNQANSQNTIDENNLLICKALNFEYQNDYLQAEENYKKILETYPSNIYVLKQLSKIYLHLKDLGNTYIYINKAIKIDSNEPKLWSILSNYYLENRDDAKYYECTLMELENSKLHINYFLMNLVPKNII